MSNYCQNLWIRIYNQYWSKPTDIAQIVKYLYLSMPEKPLLVTSYFRNYLLDRKLYIQGYKWFETRNLRIHFRRMTHHRRRINGS